MPKDKVVASHVPALQTYTKRLCNIAIKSCETRWAPEDDSKVQSLHAQLNKLLNEYESLLNDKSRSTTTTGRVGKPSFSRSSFYHKEQPWDKSHSFRLAPPPVTNATSRIKTSQKLQQLDARFLLSNLPLLQNLKNLQHLNNSTNERDGR
ncbi:hypothetical protein ZYGM_000565 [Zygosaccharomyces mellis]|uniref:Uncharacterized protein n=1 Tax=Zygosaccharomyces mellis TaxID=42258 RepID=A0A4C2E0P6_9SACH|nr:hypothetical protein ZYGM_000565 [Zygosaccharomyces mellis]